MIALVPARLARFSVANAPFRAPLLQLVVVIPISFKYASPENCARVDTPAFQPKRPTRLEPTLCDASKGFGSTIVTWLTVPRIDVASREARVSKRESGSESTRPRPNSGVVRRPA